MAALQGCSCFVRDLVVGPLSLAPNGPTRRGAAAAVTAGLIGAMGVVALAPAQVAQAAPPVEVARVEVRPDLLSARVAARAPGARVEAESERSTASRMWAPPAGVLADEGKGTAMVSVAWQGKLGPAGLCNDRTTSCITAVLTTTEPYPTGFLTWLGQRRGPNRVHQGNRRANTLAGWRSMLTGGDHCSKVPDTGPTFNFINACDTHDLGYELMRFLGTQGPSIPGARKYVDSLFLNDMRADCRRRNLISRNLCYAAARLYYTVIDRISAAEGWGTPSVIGTGGVQNS